MIKTIEFTKDNSPVANAIAFASACHLDQTDKGGMPYILHPLRMMMRLRTDNEELMCVAILHDVMEDCDVTEEHLYEIGMSKKVVEAVKLLTRNLDQSYEMFIEGLRGNLYALLVKRQDLKDNSDLSRTKGIRPKDFERMERYIKAYLRVEGMLREMGYAV